MRKRKKYVCAWVLLVLCLLIGSGPVSAAKMDQKQMTLRASRKGVNVTLSWKKKKNATGYKVSRYNASGKRLQVVTTKKLKYTFEAQGMNKTYYYSVRAYQKSGSKTYYTKESEKVSVAIPTVTSKSTIKTFLKTALKPVGSTMYVWGGGWDKSDTKAGKEAVTIGVSPRWKTFFNKQKSSYNFNNHRYKIHDGLDCSGYVGWCIYNIMNTKNNKKGYVMLADRMARKYASYGWGTYTSRGSVKDHRAGDIMSSSGHVYIVVGECSDGSVVLLHSSPPGVMITGTAAKNGNSNSQAVKLAKKYMKKYYPKWYRKYPNCSRGLSYLRDYSRMRWDLSGTAVMTDPDGYRNMKPDKILQDLFSYISL